MVGKLLNKTFMSNFSWLTEFALKKVNGWETEVWLNVPVKTANCHHINLDCILNQAFVGLK